MLVFQRASAVLTACVLGLIVLAPVPPRAAVSGTWSTFGPSTILSSGRTNSIAYSQDKAKLFISFSKRFAADAPSQVWVCDVASMTFAALNNTGLDGAQPMWVRIAANETSEPVCVVGSAGPLLRFVRGAQPSPYQNGAFQSATLPVGETTHWNTGQGGSFVKLADGSLLFIARYSVLKSTDGGSTWNSICDTQTYTGIPGPMPPGAPVLYAPHYLTNAPTYSYYGYNFLFYRAPWGELVIAGESPGWFHSLDDGLTWENLNPGYTMVQRDASSTPWYLDRRFQMSLGGNVFGCGYNKDGELVLSEDPVNGDSIFRHYACGIMTPMMNGLPPGITGFGSPPQTNRAGEIFFYTSYAPGTTPPGRPPNDIYGWDGTAWNTVSTALGQGPIYTNLLGVDGMDILAASGPGIRKFATSATALPPLVNLGSAQTVTFPNPVLFTAAEDLPGPWAHEWTTREGWAVRFSAPNAAATQAWFASPGNYVINCQADNGSVRGGNSIIVHVLPAPGAVAPGIQTQPANALLSPGISATFTVVPTAASTGPLTYQWFQEGLPIAGATSPTLVTAPLTLHEDGSTFACMVCGPGGRVFSHSGTAGRLPVIVQGPVDQTVAAGQAVSFTVSASGTMPQQWEWMDNGAPIAGDAGHQAIYTIASGSSAENGHQYSVKVTNLFGSVTSNLATLTVASGNTQQVHVNFPGVGASNDGSYAPGSHVAISAPLWHPTYGGYFTGWTTSGGVVANASQQATYLTLPGSVGASIVVTPHYTTLGTQVLSVVNGTGVGQYATGDTVPLSASRAPAGYLFDHWVGSGGVTFSNSNSPSTNATMPAGDARAVALYQVDNTPVELWEFY